jgi:hypothetical protein
MRNNAAANSLQGSIWNHDQQSCAKMATSAACFSAMDCFSAATEFRTTSFVTPKTQMPFGKLSQRYRLFLQMSSKFRLRMHLSWARRLLLWSNASCTRAVCALRSAHAIQNSETYFPRFCSDLLLDYIRELLACCHASPNGRRHTIRPSHDLLGYDLDRRLCDPLGAIQCGSDRKTSSENQQARKWSAGPEGFSRTKVHGEKSCPSETSALCRDQCT